MTKENKRVIIYIVLILAVVTFASYIYFSVEKTVNNRENNVIKISEFNFEGEKIREKILQPEEYGDKILTAKFSGDILDEVSDDITLLVSRLRGLYNRIYINDVLVGTIGLANNEHVNTWNLVEKFYIKKGVIKPGINELKIISSSDFKIGISGLPIYISSSTVIEKLYSKVDFLYSQFYNIIFGILIAVAIVLLFIFSTKNIFEIKYFLFPLIILVLAIGLNDFIIKYFYVIDTITKNKLYFALLCVSCLIFARILYSFYKERRVFVVTLVISMLFFTILFFIKNKTVIAYYGYKMNYILLALVIYFIIVLVKIYRKNKTNIELLLIISLISFIIPSILEVISISFNIFYIRSAAVGFALFSFGIGMAALEIFRKKVSKTVRLAEKLKKESEMLKKNLTIDELTGIYNHRHLLDQLKELLHTRNDTLYVLVVDIDKFRLFNDLNGFDAGDLIIKQIAKIMIDVTGEKEKCFRYSGKTLVYFTFNSMISITDIAEKIRREVQLDKNITNIAKATPVTVSCGISSFPDDSLEALGVIANAKKAVEVAKKRGRNRVIKYSPLIDIELETESVIEFKQQMITDFMYSLANVIDMKDQYTGHHSEEVSRISVILGEHLGLSDEDLNALRLGSILHDFGKIGMPDEVINKKGKLTDEEYALMKEHPTKGYEIIRQIIDNRKVLDIIKYHHERIDGKGYPDGLKGDEIPYLARIVSIADTYHAMTSTRSYREAMSIEAAIEEFERCKGTQFDAEIADVFINTLKEFRMKKSS